MLVDVRFGKLDDAILKFIKSLDSCETVHVQTGVYIGHLNLNSEVLNKLENYPSFYAYSSSIMMGKNLPENVKQFYNKENWKKSHNYQEVDFEPILESYGVCDSVEQLLSFYDFESDPRKLVIFFTEMRKDQQPSNDGWRWHKWGDYIGVHAPQCEYLYDEPDIESVFVYHIYEVLD